MNKDAINLIKEGSSTLLHIAQMAQYQMEYMQERNKEAKEKMIKYTFLSGVGIVSLLIVGTVMLLDSRNNY